MERTLTKDSIEYIDNLLITNDKAVERAIVALYKLQTPEEQAGKRTNDRNGIGFNQNDAPLGTYCAKWVLSGKRLSGPYLDKSRQLALRYHRQLSVIAKNNLSMYRG